MREDVVDPDKFPLPDDQDTSGSIPAQPLEGQNDETADLIELTDVVEPLELEREKDAAEFTLFDDTFSFLNEGAETGREELALFESTAEGEEDAMADLLRLIDGPDRAPAGEESELEEIDLTSPSDSTAVEELFLEDEPEGLLRLDDLLNQEGDIAPPLFDLSDPADYSAMPDVEEAAVTITPSAIEKAIDHIVQTRYGQIIEGMIATIVEKVVLREMQALKRSLLEDEDDPAG